MQSRWRQILEHLLRPERPSLSRCLPEAERFLEQRRLSDETRARAVADCEARINAGRRAVFDAGDGVVPASMTELEREWRRLSRRDADDGLMDLWARLTPAPWHDRKRWRSDIASLRTDLAIALAADIAGVEAAEREVAALRECLVAWGAPVGKRVFYRFLDADGDAISERLALPLALASELIEGRGDARATLDRIAALEADVLGGASARLPERPLLAKSIAHAARVGATLVEAGAGIGPDPVAPLCRLWLTGYSVAAIDTRGIVLELPPLRAGAGES